MNIQNTHGRLLLAACLFLILGVCPLLRTYAQSYEAASIPVSLLENANAVIREDRRSIVVDNEEEYEEHISKAITVLNQNGVGFGHLLIQYDKEFYKVGDIALKLLDENGKLIRKFKPKEINDYGLSDAGDVTDARVKVAEINHPQYPYTVVYSYTVRHKGYFYFPSWIPQSRDHLSVEKSQLTILSPEKIRYQLLNGAPKPHTEQQDEKQLYFWQMNHLAATEPEIYAPRQLKPMVLLAPEVFKIDGYSGNIQDWESFGKFLFELNKDRDQLPEELRAKVLDITKDLKGVRAKISALYQYMQKNTRYVSIQLGIGGWQTFEADYVYENGFGDCKALSNYMKAMLKAIDIPSYTAVVKAGERAEDIHVDFASNQFNHMILCVPNLGDTVWLECTSSNSPAGYLGDFTENRHVLLVTEKGGKIVSTPYSKPEDNTQHRVSHVYLKENGDAKLKTILTKSGYQQESLRTIATQYGKTKQEQWLRKQIGIGSFSLGQFTFSDRTHSASPVYRLEYDLDVTKWAALSGSRLFMTLNQLEAREYIPPRIAERKQPVRLSYPYLDTDSIYIHLPANVRIEAMPEMPITLESEFGTYEVDLKSRDDGTLIYYRSLRMESKEMPAAYYDKFREFIKEIVSADKIQMVLSNRT